MIKAPARGAFVAVAVVAAVLGGCGRRGQHHHVITAQVIDTIKAGEVRWNEDYKSGDASRILAHFAADATVMRPGAAPVVGARELRAMVATALARPHFHMSFASDEVDVPRSGEFAAVKGAYAEDADDTGATAGAAHGVSGAFVALYRPAGDGRWLVSWLILAPGPPGGGAPPRP